MHASIDAQPHVIFVIDDSVVNLQLVIDALEAYSYEILTDRTGESGLS